VSYRNMFTGSGTIWAQVIDGAGVEVERARRINAEAAAVITIRWQRVLETTGRFLFGSRVLEVVDTGNPDQKNQWLVCTCKEVAGG
jgi:SPP1 family predicted phage head-tail adaptor